MFWLNKFRFPGGKPPVPTASTLKGAQSLVGSGHADPAVRLATIEALAQEPSPLATQTLLESLVDPDARVRLAAALVLEQMADPAHMARFTALLTDESFEVRAIAVQYLGRIRDPGAAPLLVARLADSDSDVRRAAALALGQIRDAVAIEPLVLALTDQEPSVRQAAVAALEQIDRRWIRTKAAQKAVPRLKALRQDPQPWIAAAAQKVLEKFQEAESKDTEFWNRESGIRKL
jgi:HEAT repeat protein